MNQIEKSYEEWLETLRDSFGNHTKEFDKISEQSKRLAFLSSTVFGLTTYDLDLDIEFGKDIFEIMKVIYEKRNFEYIKDESNYKKYILVCNFLINNHWLEWGGSIRGAWFNNFESIRLNDCSEDKILLSKEFIKWLMEFLEVKEEEQ